MRGHFSKVVDHEAMEACGNLNQPGTWELLKEFEHEDCEVVVETNYLVKKLMEWKAETDCGKKEGLDKIKQHYTTYDPAPIFNFHENKKYADVKYLQNLLVEKNECLFLRYRALFTLREINTEAAVYAICQALTRENFEHCSPLLKHEVAFVLAQMESVCRPAIPFLISCIDNVDEHPIVLHEALVCLGDILKSEEKPLITRFLKHPVLVVSESCEVALFYIDQRFKE